MSSRRLDRGNSSDHRSPSSVSDQREPVPPVGRGPDTLLSQTPPAPTPTQQPHYPPPSVHPEPFVNDTPVSPDQGSWVSMAASVHPGAVPSAFQPQSGIFSANVGPYFETSSQNLQASPGLISGAFGHEMTAPSPNFGPGNPDNSAYHSVMQGYETETPVALPSLQYHSAVGPPVSRQPVESDPRAQAVRLYESQNYSSQHRSISPSHQQMHMPPTSFTQQAPPGLPPSGGQPGYLEQSYEVRNQLPNYQIPPATAVQSNQNPAYLSPFPESYSQQQMSPQYSLPAIYPTMQEQTPGLSPLQSLAGTVPSRHSPSPVPLDQVRVVNPRPKPQCWEHGCNGREFSTFSNLLRHQREKAGLSAKPECPYCGTVFTRTTARNGHLSQGKCKARRQSTPK